ACELRRSIPRCDPGTRSFPPARRPRPSPGPRARGRYQSPAPGPPPPRAAVGGPARPDRARSACWSAPTPLPAPRPAAPHPGVNWNDAPGSRAGPDRAGSAGRHSRVELAHDAGQEAPHLLGRVVPVEDGQVGVALADLLEELGTGDVVDARPEDNRVEALVAPQMSKVGVGGHAHD